MNELIQLKKEARKLLDEVNKNYEISASGKITYLPTGYNCPFEKDSFKERIVKLRQKLLALTAKTKSIKPIR